MKQIFLGKPHQSIIDWINRRPYDPPDPPTPPTPAYHEDTWYKYADDTKWRITNLKGQIFRFEEGISSEDGDGYIDDYTSIVAIEIGTDVTSIGSMAFDSCYNLTSVTIGNGVTSIGFEAFINCGNLTNVTIPDQVTSIGVQAFFNCSGLTSVTIGNGVMNIGSSVFIGCGSLTSVTFVGKTLEQIQNIEDGNGNKYYPWGISDVSIISVA